MCKEERKFLLMVTLGSVVPNELFQKFNTCKNCAFAFTNTSMGQKTGGMRKECNKRKIIAICLPSGALMAAQYCYNWKQSVV